MGGPLTIWVRLTAAHLPEREVDDGGIELMTAVEPRPTIGLVCTRDWIDDLARNPAEAHASLVARLMEGVMELWELPSESVETFLHAWNLTPPIGLLRPYSASLSRVISAKTIWCHGHSQRAVALIGDCESQRSACRSNVTRVVKR